MQVLIANVKAKNKIKFKYNDQDVSIDVPNDFDIGEPTEFLKAIEYALVNRPSSRGNVNEVLRLRNENFSVAEIAEKLGTSKNAVYKILKLRGLPTDKMSENVKEQILSLRSQNYSIKQIAKTLDLNHSTVFSFLKKQPDYKKKLYD
jgi:DNA-binding CsgD family transcriptional regulator